MRGESLRFLWTRPARWRRVVALAALAVGASVAATQVISGELSGTVADHGAALPGVTVEVVNEETGFRRATVSDASGGFRILGLLPGRYTVKAELAGFSTQTQRSVQVGVGQSATIAIDFGGPVPSVEDVVVKRPGHSSGGSGPPPAPPSPPPRCQVTRESFSEDVGLSSWLRGRKGVISIIDAGVGRSLFVQCPSLGLDDPVYVVLPVREPRDAKRLQDRINQHEAFTFVGVHQLSETSYALVFRRDRQ